VVDEIQLLEGEDYIRDLIKAKPDLVFDEVCVEYNKNFEPKVGRSTIDRTLKKMNITRKTRFDGRNPRKIN